MRIAFHSVDFPVRPGQFTIEPAGYWRMVLPGLALAAHGHDVVLARTVDVDADGSFVAIDPDGRRQAGCEIFVFQRFMHRGGAELARRAKAAGQVVVNDVDDDYWALPQGMARDAGDPKNNPVFNRDHYAAFLRESSAITVSTAHLQRVFARFAPPVHLARNAVDLAGWAPRDHRHAGLVGWVGGLPWRGADMEILRRGVAPYLKQTGRLMYHGGATPGMGAAMYERLGLPREQVREARIVEIAQYPHLWDPIEVALVPLEPSTFNQSKSWVKGLEACARGLPFIHSPHAEYALLGAGTEARRPWQWAERLQQLEDPAVRAEEGARNRARAEELSIERQWQRWENIYGQLVPEAVAA